MVHPRKSAFGKTRNNDSGSDAAGPANFFLTSEQIRLRDPLDAFRQPGASVSLLTDFPIRDPEKEKRAIQNGPSQWAYYVMRLNNVWRPRSGMGWGPQDFDDRVREVYRLCFERAGTNKKKAKEISDFIAYFPHLYPGSMWIAEFLAAYPRERDWFLKAARSGHRRSGSRMLHCRLERSFSVEDGFLVFPKIYKHLESELERIEPRLSLKPSQRYEDVRQRATVEIKNLLGALIKEYPRLRPREVSKRLKRFLVSNQRRKAALLIAARFGGCREKDLEERLKWSHWGRRTTVSSGNHSR